MFRNSVPNPKTVSGFSVVSCYRFMLLLEMKKKAKHKNEKYKFSHADHVNKIKYYCAGGSFWLSPRTRKRREETKEKSKRIVNDCEPLQKDLLVFRRLKYSDGFLMNQQIWFLCLFSFFKKKCMWTFNSFCGFFSYSVVVNNLNFSLSSKTTEHKKI